MHRVVAILPLLLFVVGAKEPAHPQRDCTSAREYVATVNYLRAKKEFALTDEQVRQVADQISGHCTGAASRFISATELLIRSGVGATEASRTALSYAGADEESFKAFLHFFRFAFAKDRLDLDAPSAIDFAKRHSQNLKRAFKDVAKDFDVVLDFCLDKRDAELPIPQCAGLAGRIALAGEEGEQGLGKKFVAAFYYLRKEGDRRPGLGSGDALKLAEQLMTYGPDSVDNFRDGFDFAISDKGLKLSREDAIEFGNKMAKRTTGSSSKQ